MRIQLLILLFFISYSTHSQISTGSQWKWVKGDSITNSPSVFGTQGIPAAANQPGARSGSSSWSDTKGLLWLFGGNIGTGNMNDLWQYNTNNNMWTWVSGLTSTGAYSLYGTAGVAGTSVPGARQGASYCTDTTGKFWMFGGFGNGSSGTEYLNDLWMYNPQTNQWTWYNPALTPVVRKNGVMWSDKSGNLWLFGGDEQEV